MSNCQGSTLSAEACSTHSTGSRSGMSSPSFDENSKPFGWDNIQSQSQTNPLSFEFRLLVPTGGDSPNWIPDVTTWRLVPLFPHCLEATIYRCFFSRTHSHGVKAKVHGLLSTQLMRMAAKDRFRFTRMTIGFKDLVWLWLSGEVVMSIIATSM